MGEKRRKSNKKKQQQPNLETNQEKAVNETFDVLVSRWIVGMRQVVDRTERGNEHRKAGRGLETVRGWAFCHLLAVPDRAQQFGSSRQAGRQGRSLSQWTPRRWSLAVILFDTCVCVCVRVSQCCRAARAARMPPCHLRVLVAALWCLEPSHHHHHHHQLVRQFLPGGLLAVLFPDCFIGHLSCTLWSSAYSHGCCVRLRMSCALRCCWRGSGIAVRHPYQSRALPCLS